MHQPGHDAVLNLDALHPKQTAHLGGFDHT